MIQEFMSTGSENYAAKVLENQAEKFNWTSPSIPIEEKMLQTA
jgi:hypothetical protein